MGVSGDVSIESYDGGVRIVPDGWINSSAPDAFAYLNVLGGSMLVRTDEAALPWFELPEPIEAFWWVAPVLGESVEAGLHEVLDGRSERARAHAELSPVGISACRAAVGTWLHRWWPSTSHRIPPFDVSLLEIEIAKEAWQAENCIGDTVMAEELLKRNITTLHREFSQIDWRKAPEEQGEGARMIRLAVQAALDTCDAKTSGMDELRAAYETATDAQWESAIASWSAQEPASPPAMGDRTASIAGNQNSRPESATVDWALVSPRTVSFYDGNITWSWHGENLNRTLKVTVEAGSSPRSSLWARVLRSVDSKVITDFELTLNGNVYEGTIPANGIVENFVIEVFDPMYDRGPAYATKIEAVELRRRVLNRILSRKRIAEKQEPNSSDEFLRLFFAEAKAWGLPT